MSAALCLISMLGLLPRDDLRQELLYAAKLRDRGLLRLAEVHCQQLLRSDELEEADRGKVAIELAKTLSARALNSRPPQREQFWQAADALLDKALATAGQPAKILLRTQQALTTLLRADWARREAEVRAHTEDDWQAARTLLRKAIGQLKQVEAELQAPELRSATASAELNGEHANELLRNVRLQLAKGYWNQAITYANDPTDRVNSLTLALDTLEPLATSRLVDALVWEARVERIRCLRLLQEYEQAGQLLGESTDAPETYMPLFAAEGIRLALAVNNPTAAMRLAKTSSSHRHPEFELALIETLVTLAADETKAPAESQALQQQASRLASTLAADFGTYWGLLAEMLIARLADKPAAANNTQLLETAAKSFLQRNLPADAIEMFASAAAQAEAVRDYAGALDYQTQAAAVDHQQGQLQAAIDRLRSAALKYDAQAAASDAHLSAAFNAAALYQQAARTKRADADTLLAQYESLLVEHTAKWPGHRSANQARLWLARLWQATGKLDEAIRVYQAISPTAAESLERFQRLTTLYLSLPPESGQRALAARRWFDNQSQLVAAGSVESTAALVSSAELRLLQQPTDYLGADASLRRALASLPVSSPELPRLHGLLVLAAAGRQQMSVARNELAKALPLPAAALSRLLHGLQIIHDERPDDTELLAMMGQVAKLLTTYREQLAAPDLLLLKETEADTLRFSDHDHATEIYAELAAAHPTSGRIQEKYAELLSLGENRATRLKALDQWRLVNRKSEPRSTAWFRAKLGVAMSHVALGQREQAKEIIDVLLSLHPELGGPALKSSFLQLRESLDD